MHKIAVIASHPVQYHSPWYRALASKVDLHVYYVHQASPEEQAAAGFQVAFDWDTPLFDGYAFTVLENRARHPGINHFFGCNTPEIGEHLARENFDAVLVNGWNLRSYWQAVTAARRRGTPVMVRGDSQLMTARSLWLRAAKRILYPMILRRFDAFLSVGQCHSQYLKHYGVASERIFHVPHCVDNDFFRTTAEAARCAEGGPRCRFGIPEDKVIFLFVGKFTEKKRPHDFLKALDCLQQERCGAWGLLIGDGPLRPALEAHVRQHGTPCSFGGFLNQREIGAAYAASDVLVLPSASETWGLVVNEAMACGLPAIVSDAAGCVPDLILDGETGFRYKMGQVDQLAQRMRRLADDADLRRSLSKGAVEHVANFSIERACGGALAAMDWVVGKGKVA